MGSCRHPQTHGSQHCPWHAQHSPPCPLGTQPEPTVQQGRKRGDSRSERVCRSADAAADCLIHAHVCMCVRCTPPPHTHLDKRKAAVQGSCSSKGSLAAASWSLQENTQQRRFVTALHLHDGSKAVLQVGRRGSRYLQQTVLISALNLSGKPRNTAQLMQAICLHCSTGG